MQKPPRFVSPVIVFSMVSALMTSTIRGEGVSTEAYVKWGNATLDERNAAGGATAEILGDYSTVTNGTPYAFLARASSDASYRKAQVRMEMAWGPHPPVFDNHIVGGSCAMTDLVSIAGLTTTGLVVYSLALVEMNAFPLDDSAYPSLTQDFSLSYDGADLPLAVIQDISSHDADGREVYRERILEASNVVTFGEQHSVGLVLHAELNMHNQGSILYRRVSFELLRVTAKSLSGDSLEGAYSQVGTAGYLAPRASPLFVDAAEDHARVSWHSLTGRQYQAQRLVAADDDTWADIGALSRGTGTNNAMICTNAESSVVLRVVEHY